MRLRECLTMAALLTDHDRFSERRAAGSTCRRFRDWPRQKL